MFSASWLNDIHNPATFALFPIVGYSDTQSESICIIHLEVLVVGTNTTCRYAAGEADASLLRKN